MKTKIFKHKLLTVGAIAALGLGVSISAQAAPEAYAVSIQKTTNFNVQFLDEAGNPLDPIQAQTDVEGTLEARSGCATDITPPDGDLEIVGFPFPPQPAPINVLVANCNSAVAEDDYNPVGKVGPSYGTGDAVLSDTGFAGTGAGSNKGEAYTDLPDLSDYRGDGSFSLSVEFTLTQNATIDASFTSEYMAFAELVDSNGDASAASATLTVLLTIEDVTDQDPANHFNVLTIEPAELNTVEAVSGKGSSEDGINLLVIDNFNGVSDLLIAGNRYKLEFLAIERAAVTLGSDNEIGDHYLCYKSFGHFLREEVNLVDQFDNVNFDVLKPKMFCNPAIKPELDPEAGILNFDAHLLSYKINEAHREPRHERQTVLIRDQFFSALELLTVNPDRLMVPSGKSLDGTVPADQTGAINHFKCYRVRTLGGFQSLSVNVADQFTDPDVDLSDPLAEPPAVGKDLVLVRPTRMCTPVSKNGEEILPLPANADPNDPRDHLMCYGVTADRGSRLNRRTEVTSNNQFGSEDLVLKRELEFCAPATKTVITGP